MSYSLNNSVVPNSEAEALKQMIFKRAMERAQTLNEETQKNYTKTVHAEIMNLARESFISNKNPFSEKKEVDKYEEKVNSQEIGFAKRQVKEFKKAIEEKNNLNNSEIINIEIESAMSEARANLSNKKTFIGALQFLNTQATIDLVQKKAKNFEILA